MSGRSPTSRKAVELRREIGEARGPNGRRLCTWCRTEVPKGRRGWCSDGCVAAYRIQADPGFFRAEVRRRDAGVCAGCGLDTAALERDLDEIRHEENEPHSLNQHSGIRRLYAAMHGIHWDRWVFHLWEADHIVPIAEGGTDSLENARTLCLTCHKAATAALRKRLRKQPDLPLSHAPP